jgi:hypothetical protein
MKTLNQITILLLVSMIIACKTSDNKEAGEKSKQVIIDTAKIAQVDYDTFNVSASPTIQPPVEKEKVVPNKALSLAYGTTFGECAGYCNHDYLFSSDKIEYIKRSHNAKKDPPITETLAISSQQFNKVIAAIDFDTFKNLDEKIGCPDCDDTGAGWLEISDEKTTHRVRFERLNPPAELKELVGIIHSILEKE